MSFCSYEATKNRMKYYVSYGDSSETSPDMDTTLECKRWIERSLFGGTPFWIVEHRTIRRGVR